MGLTSRATMVVAVVLTVALPLASLVLWRRVKGPHVLRDLQRLALVAGAQVSAVLLVFMLVNNQYQFFTTWGEVFGQTGNAPAIQADPAVANARPASGVLASGPVLRRVVKAGTWSTRAGRTIDEWVVGPSSRIRQEIIVNLPPEYDMPKYSHMAFPVIEFLGGFRGNPHGVVNVFHPVSAVRAAAKAGTLQPVITVIPMVNVAHPRDTECTDVPNGPQAETWLARDVRAIVLHQFRAQSGPHSWAVMGYSTGGYCAAKLALHYPQWYATSVPLGGYFTALADNTTGDLWGGSVQRRNENDLLWWELHQPLPAINMLLFTTRTDWSSFPTSQQFLAHVQPPMQVSMILSAKGGHGPAPVRAAFPEIFAWIGAHLPLPEPQALGTAPPLLQPIVPLPSTSTHKARTHAQRRSSRIVTAIPSLHPRTPPPRPPLSPSPHPPSRPIKR